MKAINKLIFVLSFGLIGQISVDGVYAQKYVDDLYSSPRSTSYTKEQKVERRSQRQQAANRDRYYANGGNYYGNNSKDYNELVTSYDEALARRLDAYNDTEQYSDGYYNLMDEYRGILIDKYDQNLYNVIQFNNMMWVEPQDITALFDGSDPAQGVTRYAEAKKVRSQQMKLNQKNSSKGKSTKISVYVNPWGGGFYPYYNNWWNPGYYGGFGFGFGFGGWGPSWYDNYYGGGYWPGYYPNYWPGYYPNYWPGYWPGGGCRPPVICPGGGGWHSNRRPSVVYGGSGSVRPGGSIRPGSNNGQRPVYRPGSNTATNVIDYGGRPGGGNSVRPSTRPNQNTRPSVRPDTNRPGDQNQGYNRPNRPTKDQWEQTQRPNNNNNNVRPSRPNYNNSNSSFSRPSNTNTRPSAPQPSRGGGFDSGRRR